MTAAVDLYDGVKKSVISAVKWLSQVFSGRGVELLQGGPSIMAEAIARHNATSLAGGIKDVAITSTKIALHAAGDAAAASGSLVDVVVNILQRIAKMVDYCAQRFMINRVFDQARRQWYNEGIYKTHHDNFNHWFKNACVCTPVIAALTMNSGFTAHPYRFLALLSNENEIATQDQFNKGVKHIEKLKSLSIEYVKEYQDNYKVEFWSRDESVNNHLKNVLA